MNWIEITSILGVEMNKDTYAEIFNATDCDNDLNVSPTEFQMAINGEFCVGEMGIEKKLKDKWSKKKCRKMKKNGRCNEKKVKKNCKKTCKKIWWKIVIDVIVYICKKLVLGLD